MKTSPTVKPSPVKLSSVQQLKSILAAPPAVCMICCADELRRARTRNAIKTKLQPSHTTRINAQEFNKSSLRRVLDEIANLSIFSSPQLVVIEGVEEIPSDLINELIPGLISLERQKVGRQVSLLLMAKKPLARTSKLVTLLSSWNSYIELEELSSTELVRWCERELRRVGLTDYEQNVVEKLIEQSSSDLDMLAQQIEVLSLYSDNEKVSLETLEKVFLQIVVANEYQLTEYLSQGNYKQAELLLQKIINNDKNVFLLLGMLAKNYQQCLQIKLLEDSGLGQGEIRQTLKLKPWLFDKLKNCSRRYSIAKLESCLSGLLRADSKLKNKSLGAEEIFSSVIRTSLA